MLRYFKLEELITTSLKSSRDSIKIYIINILGLLKDLRLIKSKIDN